MNCHVINLMSPVRHTCQWDIGSGQCAVKAEQSVPAGGRSHFFNVSGTMGCFFLDHCCILTTALPLVQSAAPFIETGSCVKRDRHFQPIRGSSPEVTHFQSHFLWWNQCSHLLAENLNFTHTHTNVWTMNWSLLMLSWVSCPNGIFLASLTHNDTYSKMPQHSIYVF